MGQPNDPYGQPQPDGQAGGLSFPPPAGPPSANPDVGPPVGTPPGFQDIGASGPIVSETVTSSGGGGGRLAWVAALVGAVVLLAGGAFFAFGALGAAGGADSPEDAVEQLLAAINAEDAITVGELLDPGERRTIVQPVLTDILPELQRLGALGSEFDAAGVDGLDLELTDVTYRIEPVSGQDDLVQVWFTGGSASSEATAADFPWGDAIRDRFGDDIEDSPRTTDPIEEAETPLALVAHDGRWYVSMWHSIGEAARLEAGELMPAEGSRPAAVGAASPEGAVEGMVQALVDLDLVTAIGHIDPEEGAALYRYSPLFLGDAQPALDEVRRDAAEAGVRWDVTDLGFDVETSGDDANVTIREFTATVNTDEIDGTFVWERARILVEVDGAVGGEAFNGSIEITPDRWTVSGFAAGVSVDLTLEVDADARTLMLSGNVDGDPVSASLSFDESGVCSPYSLQFTDLDEAGCLEELLAEGGIDAGAFQTDAIAQFSQIGDELPGVPVHVTRTDGSWFVSPTLSVMDAVTNGLQSVTPEDFEQFLADLEDDGSGIAIEDLLEAPFDAADDVSDLDGLFGGVDPLPIDPELPPLEENFGAERRVTTELAIGAGSAASVSGELASGQYDALELTLEQDATVTFSLVGTDGLLDPRIVVNQDGLVLGDNDDAPSDAPVPSSFDSYLVLDLPAGVYTVELRSFGDFGDGPYQLDVVTN